MKWTNHPRILLEVCFVQLCQNDFTSNQTDSNEKVHVLEKKLQQLKKKPTGFTETKNKYQSSRICLVLNLGRKKTCWKK